MPSSLLRFALAVVALVASASLAGCRSKPPASSDPAPAASAASSARANLFASSDDLDLPPGLLGDAGPGGLAGGGDLALEPEERSLEVALTDAGAEPRTPLTYDLAIGKPQTVVLNVTTTVKQEGQPNGGGDEPPLRLTLSVVAGEKRSADRTLLQAQVTKVQLAPGAKGIPPEAAAEMGQLSKAMEAIRMTFAVSRRGLIEDAQLSGDPETQAVASNLLPLIEGALDLLFVPMPEEAVGIGAQWTAAGPAAPGTPGAAARKTYVLKARTPTTVTVQEQLHDETPEQPIHNPEAPPGATIAAVSNETSTLNVRLTSVASSATSEENTVMTARDPTSSPPKVVVTHMKRSLRLEAR